MNNSYFEYLRFLFISSILGSLIIGLVSGVGISITSFLFYEKWSRNEE